MKNLFCLRSLNSSAAEKAVLHLEAKALCPNPAEGRRTLDPHAEGPGLESVPGQVLHRPHHDTIIPEPKKTLLITGAAHHLHIGPLLTTI